jgi:predicted outer membrane repeat protein
MKKKNYKTKYLLFLGVLLFFILTLNSVNAAETSGNDTIFVSENGNDKWDGLSKIWNGTSGPKKSIKNAENVVKINGTIYILKGTYRENSITITKNMTIVGEDQENTIIDGTNSKRIFNIIAGIKVVMNNLTLTRGYSYEYTSTGRFGGAIYNQGNLTVSNTKFINNAAEVSGGAIYHSQGNLTVINSRFSGNYAQQGGAITYVDGESFAVINSTFANNTSRGSGGAICNLYAKNFSVINSTFMNNTAIDGAHGGSISNSGENFEVINCTFTSNITTGGGCGGAIYNNGRNFTVSNSIFEGNNSLMGGAIFNDGEYFILTNSTFNGNIANVGGAIFNEADTYLTIRNCSFSDNYSKIMGGALFNKGNLNIKNTEFTMNTSQKGGAICNWLGGNLTMENSLFLRNSATDGGAIFNNNGVLDVKGSLLVYNSASNGGAVNNMDGWANIWFCRILGNGPSQIFCEYGSINANYNWWGTNRGPSGIMASVVTDIWLILTVKAYPEYVKVGGSSIITADLYHDNRGQYHDPQLGHVPDGFLIIFETTDGMLYPNDTTIENGKATTTFNSNKLGNNLIKTTLDYETLETVIIIIIGEKTATNINVENKEAQLGKQITLKAYITDYDKNPVNQGQVHFYIGNTLIGTSQVINGIATLQYTIPLDWTPGTYTITANYLENAKYLSSTDTATLTLIPATKTPTNIIVDDVENIAGKETTITTHITDKNNNPINQGQVQFKIGSTILGTANVINGTAKLNWIIPTNWKPGTYTITATYLENTQYLSSTGTATLTMMKTSSKTENNQNNRQKPQNILNNHITKSNKYSLNKGLLEFIKRSINRGLVNFEDFDSENEFDQKKIGLQSTGIIFLILLILAFLILIIEAKRKQK